MSDPAQSQGIYLADESDGWAYQSYDRLAATARAVAGVLVGRGLRPEANVTLVLPTGHTTIAAMYGVWWAGATLTLAVPPGFGDGPEYASRLAAILAQARPQVVLTSAAAAGAVREAVAMGSSDSAVVVLDDDELAVADPLAAPAAPARVSLLQFTSGSSSTPKGVKVSQANLRHNLDMIDTAIGWRPGDVGASWLPLYHDMGLVGATLTTVSKQGDFYLMRPDQFVRQPMRWLTAMTHAHHSASPSFGLGYVAKRVSEDDVQGLDLSRWRSLVIGAEPVDPVSMARFCRLLEPVGFDPTGLMPAYGLAEATLMVSMSPSGTTPKVARVNSTDLEYGTPVAITATENFDDGSHDQAGWVTGLGSPSMTVRIVDDSDREVLEGTLGQVVVEGGSVAQGYHVDPDTSEAPDSTAFQGDRLYSGDAGFLHDGELFVLGRMGTSLKVKGRSLFMEDIEARVALEAGVSRGRLAAVAVTDPESRGIALFVEQERGDWTAVAEKIIRKHLDDGFGVTIVTGERGLIKRTSSGKPRRRHMWETYAAGRTETGARVSAPADPSPTTSNQANPAPTTSAPTNLGAARTISDLILSRDEIESLLASATELANIPSNATVLLEGSIAEGFGNAGSDIDFLVLTPGDELTPTMPTILFSQGRRIEVRTRSAGQMVVQLQVAQDAGGDPERIDKDWLNRCQRFLRAVLVKEGEVSVPDLRAALPYADFCASMSQWWSRRATQSLRQTVVMTTLGANDEAIGWASDGLLQAAKSWNAAHNEGYLETKWTVLQLNRLGDTDLATRFTNLTADLRTAHRPTDELLDEALTLAAEFGVDVPRDTSAPVLTRVPKVTTWDIGGRFHVVRDDKDVFVLSSEASAVWRSVVFRRSVRKTCDGMPPELTVIMADFIRLGLVGVSWAKEGPIRTAVAMCDFSKPYTPPPCTVSPSLRLDGGVRDDTTDVSLSPLPAKRFVGAAMSLIWSNVVLENAREDLVGALQNRQGPVAQTAAHRLIVGAVRMLFSSFGITPLPSDIAPHSTAARLVPHNFPLREEIVDKLGEAQWANFVEALGSGRDGSKELAVLDELSAAIRNALHADFPSSFDSGDAWRATLDIGYDWLRLGGYLDADLPIDEARDLLTSGGTQPHLRKDSSGSTGASDDVKQGA